MGIKIASNSLLTAEPVGAGKPKSSRNRPSARRESSPDSRADTPSVETSEDTLGALFEGLGGMTPGLGGGFGGFGGFGGRGFTRFTGYGDVIQRAYGGCLGFQRRRRTCTAAISSGKVPKNL